MVEKLAPEIFAFPENASIPTPDTGYVNLGAKTDGRLYIKDDAGAETELGSGIEGSIADGTVGTTDNVFIRADGTGGNNIQGSAATLDDNGAATFPRRLSIVGSADEVQFSIKENATQTNRVFTILNSSDVIVASFTPSGGWFLNEADDSAGDFRHNDGNGIANIFSDASQGNVGVGTSTPDAAAKVDIVSTSQGFLPPRMTSAEWAAISGKPDGLIAYDTDLDDFVGMKNGASSLIGSPYVADGITFTDPTAQTWTALNQGSGTYTEDTTNKRLTILEDGNGSAQFHGWYTTAPSAPYSIRMCVRVWSPETASNGIAVGFRQNSTQELHIIEQFNNAAAPQFLVQKWNTATSFNANYIGNTNNRMFPNWYKIEDDNTNRIISISNDGVVWTQIHSIGRTDFLTADEIVFGVVMTTNATYDTHVSLLSYEEL